MSAQGSVTLWDIEAAVLGLSEIIESPDTTEEEKQAARGELERWVQAELKKVGGIRGFLLHCNLMASAAYAESKVMAERQHRWEERARRLKDLCIAAMQASGVKRLEGHSGVLRIQNAGGKQALKITREDLVPPEMKRYTFVLSEPQYAMLNRALAKAANAGVANARDFLVEVHPIETPDNEAIRKALETKCAKCGGDGKIKGETVHDDLAGLTTPCDQCRGYGHQLVPGAELEPRSVSLRVE